MKTQNRSQHLLSPTLLKHALAGAGLALVILAMLLMGNVEIGTWVLLPILSMSIAGATGGIFYFLMGGLFHQGGWKKAFAIISSALFYMVSLWLSLVAALNLTGHWS
jgi:hypothetical protein